MEKEDLGNEQKCPRLGLKTNITFESESVTGQCQQTTRKGFFLPIAKVDPRRVAKILGHFSGLVNVILGSVLDTAESAMVDTKLMLRNKKMLKRETKFRFNIAETKFNKLKRCLYGNVEGREELYMDLLDLIQEDISKDLKMLYFPIMHILDKHKIKNSDVMAQAEVAWSALYLACKVYEGIVKGSNHLSGTDTECFFTSVDPRDTFGAWEKLCDSICVYDPETAKDISSDKNINLAFDILLNKLCDADYVDNNCRKVLKEHPEFNERRIEEDHHARENAIADAAHNVLNKRFWKGGGVVRKFKLKN